MDPLSPDTASPAARDAQASGAGPDTIRLFDGLAPFFLGDATIQADGDISGPVNWSKIPFASLERDRALDAATVATLLVAFEHHVAAMAGLGYNAVSIDDLAHLVPHAFYPAGLTRTLASYRQLYARVFAIAKSHGLKVFVITDYLFYNDAIERHLDDGAIGPAEFFRETIRAAFDAWPELDGLILRIGESDGVDVHGDFTSRLSIRRPSEARALLDTLLPLFEARDKTLVFRTWSLGAYPIGDLIWNPRTYDAVFGDIASPNLVVSMKYGDADFFRFLGLNPLFFHGPQRKLIELQCRREYEGMGEYPSFVGWLYAGYLAELRDGGSDLAGIYALQGGGWAPFQRLAFCANASIWNELNADVAVNLFTGTSTVEEIVSRFCDRYRIAAAGDFLTLLAMSDAAIEGGLYIRELAREPAYFRRVRVPPLVWVFWNNVTSSGLVGSLSRHLVRDRATAVAEGHRAVETVEDMLRLATDRGLPADGIRFQLDTFRILALMREVLLGTDTSDTHARLAALLPPYRQAYPVGYRFDDPIHGTNERDRPLRWLFGLLLRRQPRYRRRDRLLLSRGATGLNRYLVRRQRAALPRFVDTRGMASDTLLT